MSARTISLPLALSFLLPACAGEDSLVGPADPLSEDGVVEVDADESAPASISEPPVSPPAPAVVATQQTAPGSIQLLGDSVYWIDYTDGPQIRRLHRDGGSWEKVAELKSDPFDVAADDEGLYLSLPADQSLWFAPRTESAIEDVLASSGDPLAIDLAGDFVYWTTENGCVYRGAKSGGDPDPIGCASGVPIALAVDSDSVYWGTLEGDLYGAAAEPDAVVQRLASGESFEAGLLVDSSYLFWANAQERDIRRLKRTGGIPQVVESSQLAVGGMTQDRFFLYFSSLSDGSIRKLPKQGGSVRVLSTGQGAPTDIAVAGEVIFWTNEIDGTISRLRNFY